MTQTRYMNNTAAVNTGKNSAPDNILCAKLKNKYNARVGAIAMKPKTTSQLVKAAQSGAKSYLDPYSEPKIPAQRTPHNTPQPCAAARNYTYNHISNRPTQPERKTSNGNSSYTRIYSAAENLRERNSYIAMSKPQTTANAYNRPRPSQPSVNRQAYAGTRQTNVSSQTQKQTRNINARSAVRTYTPSEDAKKESNTIVRFLKIFDIDVFGKSDAKTANAENGGVSVLKGVAGTVKNNIAGISLYAICIVMAIMVIYSFVSINNYSMDISDIESSIAELTSKESELTLKLEQKDDIRVIEQMATEQIGMVKSELVEKRFVSLAGDEKIEILGVDENKSDTADKLTFLSVFERLFSGISDYIK